MGFYEKALDSDQIGDFFENVDMARLIDHQTKFISSLVGGPASFSDDRLRQVHKHLGIGHADFDEMGKLLAEALTENGVAPEDVGTVMEAIEAKRTIIVTKDAA